MLILSEHSHELSGVLCPMFSGQSTGTQFMCSKTSKIKSTSRACACANYVCGVFLGFHRIYLVK